MLWDIINSKRINLKKGIEKKVAFHDPCYLGRRSEIYDEPRNILGSIPSLNLIELEFSRGNSFCCGGGGTGLWMDIPSVHIDLRRADQIHDAGIECVAVACPICYTMLESAMKSREYKIDVKDVSQLVKDSLA